MFFPRKWSVSFQFYFPILSKAFNSILLLVLKILPHCRFLPFILISYVGILSISLDFSKVLATEISSYAFRGLRCQSDLSFPNCVTKISSYTFASGSYPNVFIHKNFKEISANCFGAYTTDSPEIYQIKTFTFEAETPPYCGNTIISDNHINNGCKIYVPDTAVETYKAYSSLSRYASVILPISQKP